MARHDRKPGKGKPHPKHNVRHTQTGRFTISLPPATQSRPDFKVTIGGKKYVLEVKHFPRDSQTGQFIERLRRGAKAGLFEESIEPEKHGK